MRQMPLADRQENREAMSLLQPGQIIRDTYEVERFLAEGAFAEVYRVKHRFLGRQAMKVFKRTGMTRAELDEMMAEAVLLSQIAHPNIVKVFDANTVVTERGECGYFTMENVPGGSLDKFWRSHGVNWFRSKPPSTFSSRSVAAESGAQQEPAHHSP
jgi:serine/threonine-protein kinase